MAGGILKQIGPDMGGILLFMIPTLAILTLFPLFEPFIKIKRKGVAIACLSFVLTIAVFWYLLGMAFGGVGIFLPIAGISLFSGVWFEVHLVSLYLELLVLGGTLLGIIILGNEIVPAFFREEPNFVAVCSLAACIAAALFNSLAVGCFTVFLYSVISGMRLKAGRMLIPVIGAAGISFILSALPVTYQYSDVARHYDPSLYVLVLVALGVLTLVPLLFRYMDTKYRMATLYLTTTITVIILALLSLSPVQDIFHAVVAGVSTLAGSSMFIPGTALYPGMEQKILLFAGTAVLSAAIFPAVAMVMPLIWKRKDPQPPSLPPDHQDEDCDE
jgi:hypothetical protein